MTTIEPTPVMQDERTFCAVHPDRETSLQCNKCGRYMCVQCAVSTPVGYRCKECVRGHEDKFFNATPADPAIVFVVCAVLAGVGAFIAGQFGGFALLLILIASAPVGGFISEMAIRAIQRRRGRYVPVAAAVGTALGGLSPLLYILAMTGIFLPNLTILLFAGIVTATVYGRFRMRG
jgi:hypothetical protein